MKIIEKILNVVFGNHKAVFYINGPQTLPQPLEEDEENEIISKLHIDPKAKDILIERNLRLVVYIAKKFENTGVGIEDLISIGTIGLMKAIRSFKPDKQTKLATYASRCIENEILMFIRKNQNIKSELSIDEPLSVDWDGNELLLADLLGTENDFVYNTFVEKEERYIVRRALRMLEPRDREIIVLRFGLADPLGREKTQKEVADMLGITQSYISRLEKRIVNKLKDELSNK